MSIVRTKLVRSVTCGPFATVSVQDVAPHTRAAFATPGAPERARVAAARRLARWLNAFEK